MKKAEKVDLYVGLDDRREGSTSFDEVQIRFNSKVGL